MTWRGSSTMGERLLACLPYTLPFINVLGFGSYLFATVPEFSFVLIPFFPLISIYMMTVGRIPYGELIVFFLLLFLVVRNYKIKHFIRYNTMQAILLLIFVRLCYWILELIGFPLGLFPSNSADNLLINVISTTVFLGVFAAIIYSFVETIRGKYAEIPIVSEAVYMQVR
jgi:hypothetical protein